jgi:Uroporphyrinogen decarboxylase (URO-D)
VPDRVPVVLSASVFHYKYAGISPSAAFYDPASYKEPIVRTLLDFEPDAIYITTNSLSGLALEILGDKQYIVPGGPNRSVQSIQWREMEIMKDTEYDLFITDPSDYVLKYYLPRRYEALSSLAKLPSLPSIIGAYNPLLQLPGFISPEIIQAFETLSKAGREQAKFKQWRMEISEMVGMPLFVYSGGLNEPPFDLFVSYLRGMHGTMIDMFKRPEKLLTALERALEWQIARVAPASPEERGRIVPGGGNHCQSEEFLSKKQFETFVWPTWKKSLLTTINLGFIPRPWLQGKNDDRMEYFLELPKGKVCIYFEKIDMARAKEILGDHLCIAGNVPTALLWGGSPTEVEDYCKNLIKVCGKNGGFILTSSCSIDDAKPANVKAMIDSVKKYGRHD